LDIDLHVTVPRAGGRRRRGIVVHRSRTLKSSDVTTRLGMPVTTPSRTLRDLRRLLPQSQFAAALREAEFLGLPIGRSLSPDHARSELEARFLRLCRHYRIPEPLVNARVGRFIVDFSWPEADLILELDGYRAHGARSAFEADRARDAELAVLGFRVVRITWRQLADAASVAATVRSLLATPR
jgi:very-short-patch-repair endonuclease